MKLIYCPNLAFEYLHTAACLYSQMKNVKVVEWRHKVFGAVYNCRSFLSPADEYRVALLHYISNVRRSIFNFLRPFYKGQNLKLKPKTSFDLKTALPTLLRIASTLQSRTGPVHGQNRVFPVKFST